MHLKRKVFLDFHFQVLMIHGAVVDGGVGGSAVVSAVIDVNDADPALTRANLGAMLAKLKAKKLPVLLAGMYAPPNFGPQYVN